VNLFGDPPEEKQVKPTAAAIQLYYDLFKQRFGFAPRIAGGKDGKLFKTMIEAWGAEQVEELTRHFFATTNPRVLKSDYSVTALYTLAQGLLIEMRGVGIRDEKSAAIVDAIGRAVGRTEHNQKRIKQ